MIKKIISPTSFLFIANIVSIIPGGSGKAWYHPLLLMSCNLLAATVITGISIAKTKIPNNHNKAGAIKPNKKPAP